MRFRSQPVLLAILLVLSAAPATGRGWVEIFDSLQAHVQANACDGALKDAAALAKAEVPEEVAPSAALMADIVSIDCNYVLKQPEHGAAAARAALARGDADPELAGVWYESAMAAGRLDDAIEALRAVLKQDPAIHLDILRPASVWMLIRELNDAGRQADADEVEVALADANYGDRHYSVADAVRRTAVRVAIEKGDVQRAEAMARLMADGAMLAKMLTDRRFEPLWPILEDHVGPGRAKVRTLALQSAQERADRLGIAEQSDDAAEAQQELMAAYWNSGRRREALQIGAQSFTSPDGLASASEAAGWFVDYHAAHLAADGQLDASIRRYDGLTDRGIEERPWLIGLRINRAEKLLYHGRHADVLRDVDALALDAERYGNPYAQALVRMIHICALVADGRKETAARLFQPAAAEQDQPLLPYVTMRTLLCLGEEDKAGELAVRELADKSRAHGMVLWMQPSYSEDDPKEPNVRPLLARPEVAAAYAKVGRDLPESLR